MMKAGLKFVCPMHPEVQQDEPGSCPKCGMRLEQSRAKENKTENKTSGKHGSHKVPMTGWQKFKMSMTMTMGMEHTGIAGREMAKMMEVDIRNKFFFALLLAVPIIVYSPMGTMLLGLSLPSPIPKSLLLFLLATPVFFYSGWLFLFSAYKSLKHRTLNMSVLIAVGITVSYVFSVVLSLMGSEDSYYEAAVMLIAFVLFGHWMEMKSRRGSTNALQELLNLVPENARVIKNGVELQVPTTKIVIGDIFLLKPGDKVPVDGEVTEGETSIDESLVTGESFPVQKNVGSQVIGGSINVNGSVAARATRIGEDTALARIVRMVETAQNSRAPGQKIADRFAQYLVILAVGSGLITFVTWFVISGDLMMALTFAISTVVIACPDALGLATPTAVAVGTGLAAKHNILIKDAPTLENIAKIDTVVLDKTGTLTKGQPLIEDVLTFSEVSADELLAFDAAAESKSSHPLSRAVLEEAEKRNIRITKIIEKFISYPGRGIEAHIEGKAILAGNAKFLVEKGIVISVADKEIERLRREGKTVTLLAIDGKLAGLLAAVDPIKSSAVEAIKRFKKMGLEIYMITGDNERTAEAVGNKLGIEKIFADVLPEDKAKYVKKLQEQGKFVAMVGDGVNDAPALAQADIGIAIGAGTGVAIETAKVVLMKSDPLDILRAIILSKATMRKMKQNLLWASIYNILAVPVAAGLLYPRFGIVLRPEVSALLMSASSIIVAVNAVLLNKVNKKLIKNNETL